MIMVQSQLWAAKKQLKKVNISLDSLILVQIVYYQSRSVNIGIDGLNMKKYQLILVRTG